MSQESRPDLMDLEELALRSENEQARHFVAKIRNLEKKATESLSSGAIGIGLSGVMFFLGTTVGGQTNPENPGSYTGIGLIIMFGALGTGGIALGGGLKSTIESLRATHEANSYRNALATYLLQIKK